MMAQNYIPWKNLNHIKTIIHRLKTAPSPFRDEAITDEKPRIKLKPTPPLVENKKSKRDLAEDKRKKRLLSNKNDIKAVTLASSTIALGAKLAAVDGKINHKEIKHFNTAFSTTQNNKLDITHNFDNVSNDSASFEHYAKKLTTYFPDEQKVYKDLLSSLFEFGIVDGPLNVDEIMFLHKVSNIFHLSDDYFYSVVRSFIIPVSSNPFSILDVKQSASNEQVKSAFKKIIQDYHPDIFLAKNNDQVIMEIANERFNKVQSAYQKIKKLRGIK